MGVGIESGAVSVASDSITDPETHAAAERQIVRSQALAGDIADLARGAAAWTAVSVGTGPTLLAAAAARKGWDVRNNSGQTVYLGGSGVSTTNGYPLLPNEAVEDTLTNDALYAVVAAGTADVRVRVVT